MATDDEKPDQPKEKELQDGDKDQGNPRTCTCGIEVARANSLCTERDCPWKR